MGNYSNCGFYSCCCCCCCCAGDFDKTATRRDEKKFTIYSVGLLVVAHAFACNLSFGKQQPPSASSSSAVRCPGLSGLEGFIASTVPFERACMRTDRSRRGTTTIRACVCVCLFFFALSHIAADSLLIGMPAIRSSASMAR